MLLAKTATLLQLRRLHHLIVGIVTAKEFHCINVAWINVGGLVKCFPSLHHGDSRIAFLLSPHFQAGDDSSIVCDRR